MRKKGFKKEEKAQIFSLDVLLALIVLTVILGISADAMDTVSYKSQDYASRLSLERTATDAADMLVKSSGSPDNWEHYEVNNNTIPGLAKKEACITVPNTLSIVKVLKLKSEYSRLMYGNVIPYSVNSSMVLYPLNPSLNPIIVANSTVPGVASEVVVANRTVLCDFVSISVAVRISGFKTHKLSGEHEFKGEVCPHTDHNQSAGNSRWACHHFNVTRSDLNSTDFYILTDPAEVADPAGWCIDRADDQINCTEKFGGGPALINDKISAVIGNDTEAVLWFHIVKKDSENNFDGYIVGVPRGTALNDVKLSYLGPQPCFFVLKVWY